MVYLSLAVSGVRVARPKEPSSGEIILFSSYHYLSILIHYEVLFCKYESQSGFGFIGGNTTRAHGAGRDSRRTGDLSEVLRRQAGESRVLISFDSSMNRC